MVYSEQNVRGKNVLVVRNRVTEIAPAAVKKSKIVGRISNDIRPCSFFVYLSIGMH